jgi:hypothetical protein
MAGELLTRNFPPGWLAVAALALSITLFLAIIFGTFARLRGLSGGLDPLDARATGYSPDEARQLLEALGEQGRAYYRNVQLWIDTVYPASYGISRGLALLWLTSPGRAFSRGPSELSRLGLGVVPLVVMVLDYAENLGISALLDAWPEVSRETVAWVSKVSTIKSMLGAAVDVLVLLLLALTFRRWLRRKSNAGH